MAEKAAAKENEQEEFVSEEDIQKAMAELELENSTEEEEGEDATDDDDELKKGDKPYKKGKDDDDEEKDTNAVVEGEGGGEKTGDDDDDDDGDKKKAKKAMKKGDKVSDDDDDDEDGKKKAKKGVKKGHKMSTDADGGKEDKDIKKAVEGLENITVARMNQVLDLEKGEIQDFIDKYDSEKHSQPITEADEIAKALETDPVYNGIMKSLDVREETQNKKSKAIATLFKGMNEKIDAQSTLINAQADALTKITGQPIRKSAPASTPLDRFQEIEGDELSKGTISMVADRDQILDIMDDLSGISGDDPSKVNKNMMKAMTWFETNSQISNSTAAIIKKETGLTIVAQ